MWNSNLNKKLKASFTKFRDHINAIEVKIINNKLRIEEIEKKITSINAKINEIEQKIQKTTNLPLKRDDSIGNKGVRRRLDDDQITTRRRLIDDRSEVENIKKSLESAFHSLTKKQLNIFLTIYTLEEELDRPVTHNDLSKKLGLSYTAIKHHIQFLLNKNIPLIKSRNPDNLVILSIPQPFRDLKLANKLLQLSDSNSYQTKLFDDKQNKQ